MSKCLLLCEQCCLNCMCWEAIRVVSGVSAQDIEIHGACHRFPPSRNGQQTLFPMTRASTWCGEWKWIGYVGNRGRFAKTNQEIISQAKTLRADLTNANQK